MSTSSSSGSGHVDAQLLDETEVLPDDDVDQDDDQDPDEPHDGPRPPMTEPRCA